jgi:hypothetical protein
VRIGLSVAVAAGAVVVAAPPPAPRTTKAPWPRPLGAMALARRAGLTPRTHEFFAYHVHAHLDVFVNGRRAVVPAGIGIDIADPAVHRFPNPDGSIGYGGISPACKDPCISPLHTHEPDGVLHTESARTRPNRLGEFFAEWAVRLTPSCVGGYCSPGTKVRFVVNGRSYRGDPRKITLTDKKEIAIVIGRPPARIPTHWP